MVFNFLSLLRILQTSGGDHGGGTGVYGGTLPAKEAEVGEGTADVGDVKGRESGKVPDVTAACQSAAIVNQFSKRGQLLER